MAVAEGEEEVSFLHLWLCYPADVAAPFKVPFRFAPLEAEKCLAASSLDR